MANENGIPFAIEFCESLGPSMPGVRSRIANGENFIFDFRMPEIAAYEFISGAGRSPDLVEEHDVIWARPKLPAFRSGSPKESRFDQP